MKSISPLLAAALCLALSPAARADSLEALPSEANSVGKAKRVMVVWVGKDKLEPFGPGLLDAHSGQVHDGGYQSQEVKAGPGFSVSYPEFKDVDDVRDWLKDGHKVRTISGSTGKVGGAAALANLATAAIKQNCYLDAVLAIEARLASGGKSKLMKGLTKKLVGKAAKAKGDEAYVVRATLFTEKGKVVWSGVETVDHESVQAAMEERQDKRMDEQQALMEGKYKEMQPQLDEAAGKGAPKGMPPGMTPEQQAQYEAAMKSMPPGSMAPPPTAAPNPMGGGMFKKMAKMTNKVEAGGPEAWGPTVADIQWDKLGEKLPKVK